MNSPLFSPSFDFGCQSDLDDARMALENFNSHPNAFFRYANALAANGHYQLAVEMFLWTAEQSDGSSMEATFRAGVCMLFNGFFGEAALAFEASLAEFPERMISTRFLGWRFITSA